MDLFRETRKQINLLQRQREFWKDLFEATQSELRRAVGDKQYVEVTYTEPLE